MGRRGAGSISRARLAVGMAIGLVTVGACAHKVPLQATGRVPAAAGEVKLTEGPSGNTQMKLEVEHLADPQKVAPGASTYVVWVQGSGGLPQNVGALKVGDDRKGTLETATPLGEFHVFITAEPMPTAATPTSARLMSASVRGPR